MCVKPRHFLFQLDTSAISWHTIWDLECWAHVPCQLALLSPGGPLAFFQSGKACSLLESLCLNGVYLTAAQIKKLIKSLGGRPVGNMAMPHLTKLLFAIVLGPDDALTQKATEAFEHMQSQANKLENELDSDLEEVLECHKADAYNTSDLKDFEKIREKRRRQAKSKSKESLLPTPKPKGRPKKRPSTFASKLAKKRRSSHDEAEAPHPASGAASSSGLAPPAPVPEEPLPTGAASSSGLVPPAPVPEEPLPTLPMEDEPGPAPATPLPDTLPMQDASEPGTVTAPAPKERWRGRGPSADVSHEATIWPPPEGTSIGLTRVNTSMSWQAKLPKGNQHYVAYSHKPLGQNTFYAQFKPDTFNTPVPDSEVQRLNNMPLKDLMHLRKQVQSGAKAHLTSAEGRAMCARWLQSWKDEQD